MASTQKVRLSGFWPFSVWTTWPSCPPLYPIAPFTHIQTQDVSCPLSLELHPAFNVRLKLSLLPRASQPSSTLCLLLSWVTSMWDVFTSEKVFEGVLSLCDGKTLVKGATMTGQSWMVLTQHLPYIQVSEQGRKMLGNSEHLPPSPPPRHPTPMKCGPGPEEWTASKLRLWFVLLHDIKLCC